MYIFAYIDPGTGSLLFSVIIGISVSLLYVLKGWFYRLLSRFTGHKLAITNRFFERLVFFNEGKQYWHIFRPVLLELLAQDQDFVYLSADAKDPGLKYLEAQAREAYCYQSMNQAIVLLNRLVADTVVMTTPQLDVLQLKRSKQVRHYCHLLHSAGAIHTYKKFAFDEFDSVLCANKFHIQDLQSLEQKRDTKPKLLLATGCTEYDDIAEILEGGTNDILLAPTWGEKSFFPTYGEELLEQLLAEARERNCRLIYRPHPQSWISEATLLERISAKYQDEPHFVLDQETTNETSLQQSSLLICDVSGIIYDFVFRRRGSVLVLQWDWPKYAYEAFDLEIEDSSLILAQQMGQVLQKEQFPQIRNHIQELWGKTFAEQQLSEHIYHYGHAGAVAAEQILSLKASY